MRKSKTARPLPEAIHPAALLCFAAPDAPHVDIDAHIARSQRRCIDCGREISWEREGLLCDRCAAFEASRAGDGAPAVCPCCHAADAGDCAICGRCYACCGCGAGYVWPGDRAGMEVA